MFVYVITIIDLQNQFWLGSYLITLCQNVNSFWFFDVNGPILSRLLTKKIVDKKLVNILQNKTVLTGVLNKENIGS